HNSRDCRSSEVAGGFPGKFDSNCSQDAGAGAEANHRCRSSHLQDVLNQSQGYQGNRESNDSWGDAAIQIVVRQITIQCVVGSAAKEGGYGIVGNIEDVIQGSEPKSSTGHKHVDGGDCGALEWTEYDNRKTDERVCYGCARIGPCQQ